MANTESEREIYLGREHFQRFLPMYRATVAAREAGPDVPGSPAIPDRVADTAWRTLAHAYHIATNGEKIYADPATRPYWYDFATYKDFPVKYDEVPTAVDMETPWSYADQLDWVQVSSLKTFLGIGEEETKYDDAAILKVLGRHATSTTVDFLRAIVQNPIAIIAPAAQPISQ